MLSSVARFTGVNSGTVTINDDPVVIDVNVDTLDGIIARLDAANAQSSATISADAQRVTIAPGPPARGNTIELDEGTTRLLTALEITPGIYGNSAGSGIGYSSSRASQIIGALDDLNESLERLFSGQGFDAVAGVEDLRSSIRSAIGGALGTAGLDPGRHGLRALEREHSPLEIVDRSKLARGLRNAARSVQDLFGSVDARTGGQGLLGALHAILVQNRETLGLAGRGGSVSSLVDLFA